MFTAKTVTSHLTQHFHAPPAVVFPLLCPVREYEWIEPWQCEMLHSVSGVAERHCVFRTRGAAESSPDGVMPAEDIWVTSEYEPNRRIAFVRVNAHRTLCTTIVLQDDGDGTTRASVEQLLVGLTERGNAMLEETARNFAAEFRMGEAMLNHYLRTGEMLPLPQALAVAAGTAS